MVRFWVGFYTIDKYPLWESIRLDIEDTLAAMAKPVFTLGERLFSA